MRNGLAASRGHTVTTIIDLGERNRRSAERKSSCEKEKSRGDVSTRCGFENGDGGWWLKVFNESQWAEKDLADRWSRWRRGEGKFDFWMGKRMPMMTIELNMLMGAARAEIIDFGRIFALKRS